MVMPPAPAASIDAEAAAWLARLQGDSRSPASEAAFKDWIEADPAHGAAFERATDIWAILPGAALQREARVAALPPGRRRPRVPMPALALAASLLLIVASGLTLWHVASPAAYSTAVGEQKVATLEDGSRIALNTDSSVAVRYGPESRLVELERGEAMFEVAHNAERPFLVRAGGKQVRAVGTSFVVRRQGDSVIVTLLQGKVLVSDVGAPDAAAHATYLTPGERLRTAPGAPARIDAQPAEAATAWRRGQAMFGETPLADAVAELNRYGGPRIAVEDARIAALPVSGVFATNDTAEFARAVAALHGLRIEQREGTLHIVR